MAWEIRPSNNQGTFSSQNKAVSLILYWYSTWKIKNPKI